MEKWVDVDFSIHGHPFCTSSNYILISETEKDETVEILGLVDSGAGGQFIDQNYTRQKGYKTRRLEEPIIAYNVDGTRNKRGTITSFVDLTVRINERWMNL